MPSYFDPSGLRNMTPEERLEHAAAVADIRATIDKLRDTLRPGMLVPMTIDEERLAWEDALSSDKTFRFFTPLEPQVSSGGLLEKTVVRLLAFPACLTLGLLLGFICFVSPRRLSRVLEQTGRNMRKYSW